MRFAVIGLGSAGARHARNLAALGHEVVGYDPRAGREAPVTRAATLEEALAAADAAVVASPSSLHFEHASAALAAGLHTLVEKPLATGGDDAQALAEQAQAAGVTCGVAMNLRFHEGVVRMKALVDEGALGRVCVAQLSMGYALPLWRPDTDYRQSYSARADLGGGILWDAIHELDYALWLLGPVASVAADMGHVSDLEIDVEDTVAATLRFAGGALGTLDLNFVEPAYRRGCVLAGTEASARWDWVASTVVVRREGTGDVVHALDRDPAEAYTDELADFTAAIAEGRAPRATPQDGVAAVRLAEAMRTSAAERRFVSP